MTKKREQPNLTQEERDYAHEAANRGLIRLSTKRDTEEQLKIMEEAAPYLTLGIQMALSIALFFGIGYWLDNHFSTKYWVPILTAVGAVASLSYFIITVIHLSDKSDRKKKQS